MTDLLTAERALLSGTPAESIETLSLLNAADPKGLEGRTAGWLLGVALGASGRSGDAWEVLTPLTAGGGGVVAALAGATSASLYRQISRHDKALDLDLAASDALRGAEPSLRYVEARLDVLVGLSADHVGVGDRLTASRWLTEAEAVTAAESPDRVGWRSLVRIGWVRAEVALLGGDHHGALAAGQESLRLARANRGLRHIAKSLLFIGVAEWELGNTELAKAALQESVTLAERIDAKPLIWPGCIVLARLWEAIGNADEVGHCMRDAANAIESIATGLPGVLGAEWTNRPDVAAILSRPVWA